MKDILINKNGDLFIDKNGDIVITDSVAQAIRIRLLWFYQEWRFSPATGVPYFEEVFVKNPSLLRIRQIFRDKIMSVTEVKNLLELNVDLNKEKRTVKISYKAAVSDGSVLDEEVLLGG